MKIDERTVVPIGWVLSGFACVISITIVGVFWVSSVNYRLERIEGKLGIEPYHAGVLIEDAAATEKKNVDASRLPEPVQQLRVDH